MNTEDITITNPEEINEQEFWEQVLDNANKTIKEHSSIIKLHTHIKEMAERYLLDLTKLQSKQITDSLGIKEKD